MLENLKIFKILKNLKINFKTNGFYDQKVKCDSLKLIADFICENEKKEKFSYKKEDFKKYKEEKWKNFSEDFDVLFSQIIKIFINLDIISKGEKSGTYKIINIDFLEYIRKSYENSFLILFFYIKKFLENVGLIELFNNFSIENCNKIVKTIKKETNKKDENNIRNILRSMQLTYNWGISNYFYCTRSKKEKSFEFKLIFYNIDNVKTKIKNQKENSYIKTFDQNLVRKQISMLNSFEKGIYFSQEQIQKSPFKSSDFIEQFNQTEENLTLGEQDNLDKLTKKQKKKIIEKSENNKIIGQKKNNIRQRTLITYERNDENKKFAKELANGKCQFCFKKAPFESKNGPYLEIDHIIPLAENGPDQINNVIALCSNCHAEKTYHKSSKRKEEIQKKCLIQAQKLIENWKKRN